MKDDVPVMEERLRELAAGSGEVADLARELLAAREDAAARAEERVRMARDERLLEIIASNGGSWYEAAMNMARQLTEARQTIARLEAERDEACADAENRPCVRCGENMWGNPCCGCYHTEVNQLRAQLDRARTIPDRLRASAFPSREYAADLAQRILDGEPTA